MVNPLIGKNQIMLVTLSTWHAEATCVWCERSAECATVSFEDGFLQDSPLCWKCLAKAVKVRSQQEAKPTAKPTAPKAP